MRIQDMDYVPEKKNYVSEPFLYILFYVLCMYNTYLEKTSKFYTSIVLPLFYGCDISDCDRQEKYFVFSYETQHKKRRFKKLFIHKHLFYILFQMMSNRIFFCPVCNLCEE